LLCFVIMVIIILISKFITVEGLVSSVGAFLLATSLYLGGRF
jgi:hypothetical protein